VSPPPNDTTPTDADPALLSALIGIEKREHHYFSRTPRNFTNPIVPQEPDGRRDVPAREKKAGQIYFCSLGKQWRFSHEK
jgi:hypothetical protein